MYSGKIQDIIFLAICQILKYMAFEDTSVSLPVSKMLYWFHLAKGQAERQGPWASFFHDRSTKDLLDSVTPSTILLYVRATGILQDVT